MCLYEDETNRVRMLCLNTVLYIYIYIFNRSLKNKISVGHDWVDSGDGGLACFQSVISDYDRFNAIMNLVSRAVLISHNVSFVLTISATIILFINFFGRDRTRAGAVGNRRLIV